MEFFRLSEKFAYLEDLGFSTPDNWVLKSSGVGELFKGLSDSRKGLNVDIDGIVLSIDNLDILNQHGMDAHELRLKGQVALKFESDCGETTLMGVEWSMQGGLFIVPVGIHAPIVLAQATCTRVSLKSAFWVKSQNGMGVGTVLSVKRAGDVIPCVDESFPIVNVGVTSLFEYPKKCPDCSSDVMGGDSENAHLFCVNQSCPSKEAARLVSFFDVFGVKGLGWITAHQAAKNGLTVLDFLAERWDLISKKFGGVVSDRVIDKFKTAFMGS